MAEKIYAKVEGKELDVEEELKKKQYTKVKNLARKGMQMDMVQAMSGKTKEEMTQEAEKAKTQRKGFGKYISYGLMLMMCGRFIWTKYKKRQLGDEAVEVDDRE